jgi:hypothetical protein
VHRVATSHRPASRTARSNGGRASAILSLPMRAIRTHANGVVDAAQILHACTFDASGGARPMDRSHGADAMRIPIVPPLRQIFTCLFRCPPSSPANSQDQFACIACPTGHRSSRCGWITQAWLRSQVTRDVDC